ncbi:MAG: helix-turn-helix domain-containing protein [Defluviitaleaceae bacterium]|nr:helix-turn-helix domain-containing protein [Defluviitaleaceae bacterium]MCL2262852.1 helix-turn-helix domain-containing protein [Defluviitaleaceae bacterium]
MEIDYRCIGKRVRVNRKLQNMTQSELAEKTGMSDVYISYIETAKKRPSLESLLKISSVLGVSIDSLVSDTIHC